MLILLQVLGWYIILGCLARFYFRYIGIGGVFDPLDRGSFNRLPFFGQLRDALGICFGNLGQSLGITGLFAGIGYRPLFAI